MAVAAVNLTIDKGTDFSIALKIKTDSASVNLSGYGISCTMRRHHASAVGYGLSTTILSPTSSGIVKLELHKSVTSQLNPGRYVWDLLLTNPTNGETIKSAEGTIIVKGTSS